MKHSSIPRLPARTRSTNVTEVTIECKLPLIGGKIAEVVAECEAQGSVRSRGIERRAVGGGGLRLVALAQAHGQHARAGDARQVLQQGGAPGLAGNVATRHQGGQAVVVAEADLGGGDGVVLVDDRDGVQRPQRSLQRAEQRRPVHVPFEGPVPLGDPEMAVLVLDAGQETLDGVVGDVPAPLEAAHETMIANERLHEHNAALLMVVKETW